MRLKQKIQGTIGRLRNTITDLLPVSVKQAERCWEHAPEPWRRIRTMDICAVELTALFQKNPDDAQAEELAMLGRGVLSKFGQVATMNWTAEAGSRVSKSSGRPGCKLRARLTLQPTDGKVDWLALDRELRDAMAERHKRFKVSLEDPGEMGPNTAVAVAEFSRP